MRRSMRPVLVALCVLAMTDQPASAQAPETPTAATQAPSPTTLLHLSAAGTVQVAPDQLVADLVASSTSASAAAAQRHVNGLVADGMKAAGAVIGIEARATGYSVSPTDEKHAAWIAQQTIELRGADGPALSDLAGRLQEHGLVMVSLDWQLSPPLRARAHNEATTRAIRELQARAASAARTLGLRIDHLRDVQLDGPEFQPRPRVPMMAMARMSAPSPQATATPEEVDATVTAEVLLRP